MRKQMCPFIAAADRASSFCVLFHRGAGSFSNCICTHALSSRCTRAHYLLSLRGQRDTLATVAYRCVVAGAQTGSAHACAIAAKRADTRGL